MLAAMIWAVVAAGSIYLIAGGIHAVLDAIARSDQAKMGVCPHGPDYTCKFCR